MTPRPPANAALQAVGLVGNFTTTPVTSSAQNGIVQSQNPGPNTSVNKGSTVNVVIGSYTGPDDHHRARHHDHDAAPTTTTTVPRPSTT